MSDDKKDSEVKDAPKVDAESKKQDGQKSIKASKDAQKAMKAAEEAEAAAEAAIAKAKELKEAASKASEDEFKAIAEEIKAEASQFTLPPYLDKYLFKYYNSTKGTTQRKGLSGVSIMSKIEPTKVLNCPEIDEEGRILVLIYEEFILVNGYVPNSQRFECDVYYFVV